MAAGQPNQSASNQQTNTSGANPPLQGSSQNAITITIGRNGGGTAQEQH